MGPFKINAVKDGEEDIFIITVGKLKATNKTFISQEDAEKFLEEHFTQEELDMIGALILAFIDLDKKLENGIIEELKKEQQLEK